MEKLTTIQIISGIYADNYGIKHIRLRNISDEYGYITDYYPLENFHVGDMVVYSKVWADSKQGAVFPLSILPLGDYTEGQDVSSILQISVKDSSCEN